MKRERRILSRGVYAYWLDWYDEYVARINQSIENTSRKKWPYPRKPFFWVFMDTVIFYGVILDKSENKTIGESTSQKQNKNKDKRDRYKS
jgi:hypothetical protein